MVPQYLRRRSKEVVGVGVGECSYANYTTHHLPLFLNNKRIFIIVMVSWSLRESGPNMELLCLVYEQANEVEEVMVLIEFNLFTLKEVEDNLSIETYIVYEDDELALMSGIAAILRFPLPDLDGMEEGTHVDLPPYSQEFPDYVTPSLVVNRAILGFHNSCSSKLGQLQGLRQGCESVADFLGRAQVLVEDLALASRPITLDDHKLYIFKIFDRNFALWLLH
nr:eukaryotic translation initiation factor 3 subunit F-like [Ipomoea batatas]